MSIPELLATPTLFRAWLALDPDRVFPAAHRPDSCPLAVFLREVGGVYPLVGSGLLCTPAFIVYRDDACHCFEMVVPRWAARFVMYWDLFFKGDGSARWARRVALLCR